MLPTRFRFADRRFTAADVRCVFDSRAELCLASRTATQYELSVLRGMCLRFFVLDVVLNYLLRVGTGR